MNGTYQNSNFGSGNLNNGAVVSLKGNKVNGTVHGPLVITNYGDHRPKIQFDGAGGFVGRDIEHLEISGFEIEGPNQSITTLEEASQSGVETTST